MTPALVGMIVAAVALVATAQRGQRVTNPRSLALAVWALLCGLFTWTMLAPGWAGDWGGVAAVLAALPLLCYVGWYIADETAPPGISERITDAVRRHWWAAGAVVLLCAGAAIHWLTGWP